MKRITTGDCSEEGIFRLVDPTTFAEIEFEAEVIKALTCLHPEYLCGVFAGTFELEGDRRKPDLALVHKTISHWFVIEVELAGHSLENHVLPQVRCFRYGEPEPTCTTSLLNAFPGLLPDQATRILRDIPRHVAVIGNMRNEEWSMALRALDAQYLTAFTYSNGRGATAHEIDGQFVPRTQSLGFARFSAIDNSLRINKGCGLSVGQVQITDQFGSLGPWTVREESGVLWITKDRGPALLAHDAYVQILRASNGQLSLRQART